MLKCVCCLASSWNESIEEIGWALSGEPQLDWKMGDHVSWGCILPDPASLLTERKFISLPSTCIAIEQSFETHGVRVEFTGEKGQTWLYKWISHSLHSPTFSQSPNPCIVLHTSWWSLLHFLSIQGVKMVLAANSQRSRQLVVSLERPLKPKQWCIRKPVPHRFSCSYACQSARSCDGKIISVVFV